LPVHRFGAEVAARLEFGRASSNDPTVKSIFPLSGKAKPSGVPQDAQ